MQEIDFPIDSIKVCERCKVEFNCLPHDLVHCHCYGISLSPEARLKMSELYNDCLCADCLNYFATNYF